jgi:hypothetical protein
MDNPTNGTKKERKRLKMPKVLIAANGIHRNSKVRVSVGPLSVFIDPWRPMSSCMGWDEELAVRS